ncbi:MAG: zinc ribbon domain-containing protein [Flavobacteriaceae bacterium]
MAKKKEISVEDKLRALYNLQLIDSRIDEIRNVRGELPLEVEDLEDEVAGLSLRVDNFNNDIDSLNTQIKAKLNAIEESKVLMKKYTKQQENVRNNREYSSLAKETEFQELEIELAEKHIKEFKAQIAHKSEVIEKAQERLTDKQAHLGHKKDALNEIISETEKEEEALLEKSAKYEKQIEERLMIAYNRIRTNVKNGLAIVAIERGAAGGSYFTIPPQVQVEIAGRKKIITDEHSGRILVDAELAAEQKTKMEKMFAKL